VGDMVMAHTLVQLLAGQHDELHMAAPPATHALGSRMAEISTSHLLSFSHGALQFGLRKQIGRELRAHAYQAAYVLPNSWKSALVPYFANIPRRVGWQGEARFVLLNDRRQLDEERYPLMIERFMALAHPQGELPAEYPLPRLQVDPANLARVVAELGLHTERVVGLCPGAEFGAAKKWPAEHYAALARTLLEQGYNVWLLGSPKDQTDCARIAELAPGAINLAGRTQLVDAVDLLSVCQQVVCNDSGLMHIACALGVPTVGVFGSTSPGFTPPLGEHAQVAEIELVCRPCFQRECPLGHLNCLRQLQPSEVLAKLAI
ncbi:MAG: lipopolysaccharide heptosyltransferase II, partial [Pseudomonadales bacterium]